MSDYYVDSKVVGGKNDGSSWENAARKLENLDFHSDVTFWYKGSNIIENCTWKLDEPKTLKKDG